MSNQAKSIENVAGNGGKAQARGHIINLLWQAYCNQTADQRCSFLRRTEGGSVEGMGRRRSEICIVTLQPCLQQGRLARQKLVSGFRRCRCCSGYHSGSIVTDGGTLQNYRTTEIIAHGPVVASYIYERPTAGYTIFNIIHNRTRSTNEDFQSCNI